MPPLIGITCSWQEEKMSHYSSGYYIRAVAAAGGIPLLIPSQDAANAPGIYEGIDGLLLAGGPDLDPYYFGEEPLVGMGEITPLRDELELALCRLALQGPKPVLGICRGIQVLNVAAGGTLYQDLADFTKQMHSQKAPRWYPTHEVEILEESTLFSLAGAKSYRVNSFHHQGLKKLGQGLKAVAWSRDGLIEAVEAEDPSRSILGVQWHPEGTYDKDQLSFNLFSYLVEQAAGRK